MITILTKLFELIACNDNKNQIEKEEIVKIRQDIKMIKDNHLMHLQKDISDIKVDIKLINQSLLDLKIRLSK